jgi:hypothetical protein
LTGKTNFINVPGRHDLVESRRKFKPLSFDKNLYTCEFSGQGVLDPILNGILGAKTLVSPTGLEGFCKGLNSSWAIAFQGGVNAA